MPGGVQGYDRYAYVNNNPLRYTDPSGHCPWCIAVGVGAIVGAAVGYGIQVYDNYQNGVSGVDAFTTNISAEPIVNGAFIGAGLVLGVGLIATAGPAVAPLAAAGAVCADGDCTNEATAAANNINQACGGDICASEVQDSVPALGNAVTQVGDDVVSSTQQSINNVQQVADDLQNWLGDDLVALRNEAGDFILRNVENTRKFRFDFFKTFPHENPHMHLQWLNEAGKWVNERIFPKDVLPK